MKRTYSETIVESPSPRATKRRAFSPNLLPQRAMDFATHSPKPRQLHRPHYPSGPQSQSMGPPDSTVLNYMDWQKDRLHISDEGEWDRARALLFGNGYTLSHLHRSGVQWLYRHGISTQLIQCIQQGAKTYHDHLERTAYFEWLSRRLSTRNDFESILKDQLQEAYNHCMRSEVSLQDLRIRGPRWLLDHSILYVVAEPVSTSVQNYLEWCQMRNFLVWVAKILPAQSQRDSCESMWKMMEAPEMPHISLDLLQTADSKTMWDWALRFGFSWDTASLVCQESVIKAFILSQEPEWS